MFELRFTDEFVRWIDRLRDRQARRLIAERLQRMELGQFGATRAVGGPVTEARVHAGLGYRLYFTRRGAAVVVLLCGGDQSSQPRDIRRAQDLAAGLDA